MKTKTLQPFACFTITRFAVTLLTAVLFTASLLGTPARAGETKLTSPDAS